VAKVLIVGAGGVGNVVAHKCIQAKNHFSEVMLASRTKSKADTIAARINSPRLTTATVDADNVNDTVSLIRAFQPQILINVALPYQDLHLMEACLATGVHYLDTANYEPLDEAKFEYSWQWAYQDRFKERGITAILGCGFDPGVSGIFTAYALKHHFAEIHYLDIIDCNDGSHGKAFATNFNPEINIREITQRGKFWENGEWKEIDALSVHRSVKYPDIGERESYLLFHEELESLVKHIPTLKRARFWMTFSQEYITHLRVLQNVGMTRINPVLFEGQQVVPLKFLKAVLPEPATLGEGYSGTTSIGCQIRGIGKDGKELTYFIYNNCDHAVTFAETGAQAISYTTGVPAMLGASMVTRGVWNKPGVFNVEQLDPDLFLAELGSYGLPWIEKLGYPLDFAK
jgi:saccharopine dehydrogenase (NAD+, L-lysine-forming)